MMQAQLLVGPISASGSWAHGRSSRTPYHRCRWRPAVASSSSSWPSSRTAFRGGQNHYDVLGLNRSSTSADIKRAYRLLARKYHPDVSKDSRSGEVFKSIRHAYEVLSNEATRTQYDRALKLQGDTDMHHGARWGDSSEFDDGIRTYRWAELRQKMQRKKYWEQYDDDDEEFSFYSDDEDTERGQSDDKERGSFSEVLKSAFLSIFLMQTFGCWLSLTFSSCMALLDRKLDSGYKIGYIIAWILGGRGGILLTMCISFASWVCGKTSSSIVVLVVVAMWVGSNLARYAPLPQGALLTLLYMSIKLQTDLS